MLMVYLKKTIIVDFFLIEGDHRLFLSHIIFKACLTQEKKYIKTYFAPHIGSFFSLKKQFQIITSGHSKWCETFRKVV